MNRSREQAFTVVEIIIAVLLVTVVISGVTLALAGGAKLETKRDIKSRMVAATERVYEHIRSDKAWVKGCRRANATAAPKTCNLTPVIDAELLEDDIFGDTFAFTASATATGVDSDGDGLRGADQDGNADDFFSVSITIGIPAADKARLGNPPDRKVSSIVHGSTNVDSGGVVVAFCSADNQIDERVQISGCETGGTYWTEMPACANDPACLPWALGSLQGIPGSLSAPTRMLGIRPVTGVTFSLQRVADGKPFDGPGTVSSGLAMTTAQDSSLGPGVYKFPDLPTGSWRIVTPSIYPGNRVDWPTHHVPSTKQATVERNRTARALVMLQDPAKSGDYSLTFSRLTYERQFTGGVKTFKQDIKPECEAPSSFFTSAFIIGRKVCNPGNGHFIATSELGAKGQQMEEGDFYTKYESWGAYQDSVDVYHFSQSRSSNEWPGAADTGEFEMQPAPYARYTQEQGGQLVVPKYSSGTIPQAPYRPNAGWNSVGAKGAITGLPAGLHTPLTLAAKSKINNVSTTYKPAGCDPKYTWVNAASNGFGGCSGAHMVGDDNECYTHMSGGSGIPNYKWKVGCSSLLWINRLIAYPKYNLIYQICGRRQSWVRNAYEETWLENNWQWFPTAEDTAWAEENGIPWDDPRVDARRDAAEAEHRAFMRAQGYEFRDYQVEYVQSANGHFYKREDFGTTTRMHNDPCEDMRAAPLDCPALDNWGNCNRVHSVKISQSSGWDVGNGNVDGQKFQTSGLSIQSMSP